MMRIFFLIFLMPVVSYANDNAQCIHVLEKLGNIYYLDNLNQLKQITYSRADKMPILSPNTNEIAFVRKSGPTVPKNCDFGKANEPADEIWIYNLALHKERRLVSSHFSCKDPYHEIATIDQIEFSPDGKMVYFDAAAWTTSGALHAVNMNGHHNRFIMPGDDFDIIKKGRNKGYIVINQHRYWIATGSYDWYWLYSPTGKKIGPIGDYYDAPQKKFLEENKIP